jgi:hypothetical protein
VRLEGLGKLKKIYLLETRTRDLPAYSIVPQPTTLLRVLNVYYIPTKRSFTRSKARTVFPCSKAVTVGSNPTRGMDVCVCVYSVFVLSCM